MTTLLKFKNFGKGSLFPFLVVTEQSEGADKKGKDRRKP
jgi:hypothetical protein